MPSSPSTAPGAGSGGHRARSGMMNGFFGVGPLELLVIAVLALIFIGPERLPGVIRQVMSVINELRGYAEDMRQELAPELEELRQELEGVGREVNQFTADLVSSTNEMAVETQQAIATAATVNDLMAPPPPLDTAALPAPAGVSPNGAGPDDDERPVFADYRPQ